MEFVNHILVLRDKVTFQNRSKCYYVSGSAFIFHTVIFLTMITFMILRKIKKKNEKNSGRRLKKKRKKNFKKRGLNPNMHSATIFLTPLKFARVLSHSKTFCDFIKWKGHTEKKRGRCFRRDFL